MDYLHGIAALTDAASDATFNEKDHVNVGDQLQLDSRVFEHSVPCEFRCCVVVSWIETVCGSHCGNSYKRLPIEERPF